jgi:CRISPR/Cas system-associated exonuclease Cas4 (RecB family)
MSNAQSEGTPVRPKAERWPRLSKSKIAAFEHCPKRLWLQIYRREVGKIDPRTKQLFANGHRLGELARLQLPNGILLDTDPQRVDEAIEETTAILRGSWDRPIFEAALRYQDVIVRPDILHPDGWGGWSLIEVKNSTAVRPYQLRDVATQTWVARESGVCISRVIIRHPGKRLSNPHARALPGPLIDVNVTGELRHLVQTRPRVADDARKISRGAEPDTAPGSHCTYPFRCEFRDYCLSRHQSRTTSQRA